MQISYIPPVTTSSNNFLQSTIEKAINNAIVNPFKLWVYEITSKTMMLAEWGLIFGCAVGVILWICGVEKGKKTTIVCALIFVGLQIVKVVFM
ncbi:MAG: hypothetical protein E7231_00530 [Cellulosilyticum sp.]|nr:hypothetical protein [Cellulosilyticum sp.]